MLRQKTYMLQQAPDCTGGLNDRIINMTFPGMLLEIHPVNHPLSTELLRKSFIRSRGQLQVSIAHLVGIHLSKSMCDCYNIFDLVHVSQQVRRAQQRSGTHLTSI